jgi:hypothetical protein
MKAVCTTNGDAQLQAFASAECSGEPISVYSLSSAANITLGACTRNSFSSSSSGSSSSSSSSSSTFTKYSCYGERVAPFSPMAALASKSCAGAALPSTESSISLSCFSGAVNISSPENSAVMPFSSPDMKVCIALTGKMNGHLVRYYAGAPSIDAAASMTLAFSEAADVTMCTSNRCNNPTSDKCATAGGVLPVLSPFVCGSAPASGVPPSAATAPIACYNNIRSTSLSLQATPVSGLCIAGTHRCQGAGDTFPTCDGKAAGTTVRMYSDVNTLIEVMGSGAASGYQSMIGTYFSGAVATSGSLMRVGFDAVVLCNTAGW